MGQGTWDLTNFYKRRIYSEKIQTRNCCELQVARSKKKPDPQLTTQFAHRLKSVATKTKPAKAG
jgi:hypothetical protein